MDHDAAGRPAGSAARAPPVDPGMTETSDSRPTVDRRSLLGAAAAVSITGSAGCAGRVRSLRAEDAPDHVSLTIRTTPADDDPYAIRITQRLAAHLEAVGVDVEVVPMRNDRLLDAVLIEEDFDCYLAAHPGGVDPDFLYPLFHSRFADEPGWPNPFGYDDGELDALLERQRRLTGDARREAVEALQRQIAEGQPLSVVAFPDAIGAVQRGRFRGWSPTGVDSTVSYLTLERDGPRPGADATSRAAGGTTGTAATFRVALTDRRATRNLNPIAVPFRNRGTVTDLLYDSLALRHAGQYVPWLADAWEWAASGSSDGPVATVRLREGLTWHDGRPITAADVVFTYRFIADTSMGRAAEPVPAPRFRGGESLVRRSVALDRRTVRLEFAPVAESVAVRALTVPMLPAHEWRDRTGPATVAGLPLVEGATEALAAANLEPVGSGPLTVESIVEDESLVLERFPDYFAWAGAEALPEPLAGPPAYDRLDVRIVPSDGAAVELLAAGELDATGRSLHARAVPAAVRAPALRVVVQPSHAFYHLGFNTREAPLDDPAFRRAVAGLIDKAAVVADVFGGYATPAVSPLDRTGWLDPGLDWTDRDPVVPFLGEDGSLDADRARRAFRAAGYRYDRAGHLLSRRPRRG